MVPCQLRTRTRHSMNQHHEAVVTFRDIGQWTVFCDCGHMIVGESSYIAFSQWMHHRTHEHHETGVHNELPSDIAI